MTVIVASTQSIADIWGYENLGSDGRYGFVGFFDDLKKLVVTAGVRIVVLEPLTGRTPKELSDMQSLLFNMERHCEIEYWSGVPGCWKYERTETQIEPDAD